MHADNAYRWKGTIYLNKVVWGMHVEHTELILLLQQYQVLSEDTRY